MNFVPNRLNTLVEYLEENYYNALCGSISNFIYHNQHNLEIKTHDLDYNYAKLDELHVKRAYPEKTDSGKINFTIQAQIDLILKYGEKRDFNEETAYLWLTIHASATMSQAFQDFKILSVTEYEQNKFSRDTSLSKGFIPYISNDDLESYAEKFLSKFYPLALTKPTKLPVDDIMTRMGLHKEYAPLEDNVFGRIFFNKAKAKVYQNNNIVEKDLEEGTVLINRNCFFMMNYGNEDNTKIHECVHWWLHKDFFEYLKIIDCSRKYISCELEQEYSDNGQFTNELNWMEWQACSIAPKIMIPRNTGITKFKECLDEAGMNDESSIFGKNVRFDTAVDLFSNFFGVTKISAKIRLIELGFTHAIGVYNFIDGKVQDAFYFKDDFLKPGQTFLVDPKNAAIESLMNPALKKRLQNGELLYINNVFVINDEKYVKFFNNGKPYLTAYALEHMDECCMVFETDIRKDKKITYFNLCYLCSSINISNSIELRYSSQNKAELDNESLVKLRKKSLEEEEFFKTLPANAGLTIKAHLKRKEMTHQQLADRSHISKRNIDYYISEYDESNPDIYDIVAICIGLNLSPNYSRDLLKKFGFDIDSRHDNNYNSLRFIIESCHQCTIDSCNDILKQLGCNKILPGNSKKVKK